MIERPLLRDRVRTAAARRASDARPSPSLRPEAVAERDPSRSRGAGSEPVWRRLTERMIDAAFMSRHQHFVFDAWCLAADLAIRLVREALRDGLRIDPLELKDLQFTAPLVVRDSAPVALQVDYSDSDDGRRVRVVSRPATSVEAVVHFRCTVGTASEVRSGTVPAPFRTWPGDPLPHGSRSARGSPVAFDGRASAIRLGDGYGSLSLLERHGDMHTAVYVVETRTTAGDPAIDSQPANACFAAAIASGEQLARADDTFLPSSVSVVTFVGVPAGRPWFLRWTLESETSDRVCVVNVLLSDALGNPVVAMENLRLVRTTRERFLTRVGATGTVDTRPLDCRPPAGDDRSTVPAPQSGSSRSEIAVIGVSGRFPGAGTVDELWENLCEARCSVTDVPAERWREFGAWYDPDARIPGTSSSKRGGFVDGVEWFDPAYFGISRADARLMDPQQRLLLQEAVRALDNAGLESGRLSGTACGVFIGGTKSDYDRVLDATGHHGEGKAFTGTSASMLAANVAYQLGLVGPTFVIDTACSSSLSAVHLACECLASGEAELAVAGGVNLFLSPISHIHTSQVGMQSSSGLCRSFDAGADGTVFSEACAVVVLKRFDDAVRDGDPIRAVISGSGINQDGKTNGITAPSSTSQGRLIRRVLEQAAIDPAEVGYIEAHGTATPLGDPIEVKALVDALGRPPSGRGSRLIGSIKSNVGHCSYAAGIVGLIKCVLSLENELIPASLHYTEPNPRIDFARFGIEVNTRLREWTDGGHAPRYCAVSSFGFGGSNAHVVLKSAGRSSTHGGVAVPTRRETPSFLLPICAGSVESLRTRCHELHRYLSVRLSTNSRFVEPSLTVQNMAFTLERRGCGRPFRYLVSATCLAELSGTLRQLSSQDVDVPRVGVRSSDNLRSTAGVSNDVESDPPGPDHETLPPTAERWIRGEGHGGGLNRFDADAVCLNLPGYAFSRIHVWPDGTGLSDGAPPRPRSQVDRDRAFAPASIANRSGVCSRRSGTAGASMPASTGLDEAEFLALVGEAIEADPESLRLDLRLSDLGIDSINVKDLLRRLNLRCGTSLSVATFFACKTLGSLHALVVRSIGGEDRRSRDVALDGTTESKPDAIRATVTNLPLFDETEIRRSRFFQDICETIAGDSP